MTGFHGSARSGVRGLGVSEWRLGDCGQLIAFIWSTFSGLGLSAWGMILRRLNLSTINHRCRVKHLASTLPKTNHTACQGELGSLRQTIKVQRVALTLGSSLS